MSPARIGRRTGILALLALALAGRPAAAQSPDPVEVVAGPRYAAGPLRQRVLGRDYRDLWTTPARIPVLDLGSFAGGLTPVERGGGEQTRSLRLRGEDGREYNFRSVDKWVTPDPRSDLAGTAAEALVQDQVSSLHPAAAVVATALLDAVGILNPGPRLVVMPDDPRLGEFREDFAGMLGTVEIHADEAEDGSWSFGGSLEVVGEEAFFRALRESSANRVDARALLAERLMSLLMADWDRHAGQYRWARFDSAGVHRWVPVPEDRDYAFADYDGLVFRLLGSVFAEQAPFGERYRTDLTGLTLNSAQVDRRLLAGLPWPVWEEVAARLRADLTDAEIEAAVRLMPPEYFQRSGPELIRVLRARREGLPRVARRFYLQLAREPEVHATDAPDRAEILRLPDGSVRVTLSAAGDAAGSYFDRTFVPDETDEVRVHLHGGDDRAVLRGQAERGPLVRVVGGAGADTLRDLSRVAGRGLRTAFHDDQGENEFEAGGEAVVDRAPYREPVWIPGEVRPPRDWGAERSWFTPWATYERVQGLVLGGGPRWTWYGFRRVPFAAQVRIRGMYAPSSGEFGVDAAADLRGVGSAPDLWLHGRVSALEDFRFHGLGNDSPDEVPGEVVHLVQSLLEARLRYQPAAGVSLGAGPVLEYLEPDPDAAALARFPLAARASYGKVGMAAEAALDTRAEGGVERGGFALRADGHFFPAAWDLTEPFGRLHARAAGYAPLPGRSLLAVRAGGAQVLGESPLLDRVSLGGGETLRGFAHQRFTGDAMLYGTLELRTLLARAELGVRGDLGVLAFTDVGRVFEDGVSEGGWHRGAGAGVWFRSLGYAVSATYARGDEHRFYLSLGMPF